MGFLADRLQRIGESATLRISAKAKQLIAEGVDVIDLSIGEPDFPTPENIKKAGIKAIQDNFTHYTANDGIPLLKQAIINKLHHENGLEYSPKQIIVSTGAKNCLFNLCVAILNKGDEVIIPAPYWVSYPAIVNLAKGVPVFVKCPEENGFRLQPKDFAEAITPRTKALVLNNPCNPSGAAYAREELEEIMKIAAADDIIVIADEIYEKLIYDGLRFHSAASISPKAGEITVVINGFSKAFSMTGWRLGYAAGPAEIIAGMNLIQGHNTSNACSISQQAAIEALNGPQVDIEKMVYEFHRRRNLALSRLRSIPGLSCAQPRGAFYLFPNFSAYFEKEHDGQPIRNSYGLAYYLMKQAHVAVVPGDAFGMEGYLRLSYATSMDRIDEGIDRIAGALADLVPSRRARGKALNNTITAQRTFVETDTMVNIEMREALAAEAEATFTHDSYYEWNVNIAGVIIQLRTNSPHLNEFWVENFYPAELEAEIEPHGIIYAVKGATGREARAFYNADSHTAFFFNSAYYAQLRSLAIGIVADISQKISNSQMMNAACFETNGRGALLFFSPGVSRTSRIAGLLKYGNCRIVSGDLTFGRISGAGAIGECVERKLYLRTELAGYLASAKELFERSKCENVVTSKDQCENEACIYDDTCDLDKGEPYCFIASRNSRVMLDPYWLGGPERHAKRAQLKTVLIFTEDSGNSAIAKIDSEQALKILEDGRPTAEAVSARSRPFFNPHLLVATSERLEQQKRFYKKLLASCECHLVNIRSAEPEKIARQVINIMAGSGTEVLR